MTKCKCTCTNKEGYQASLGKKKGLENTSSPKITIKVKRSEFSGKVRGEADDCVFWKDFLP